MIEVALQKRRAKYAGEVGLFTSDPVSQEEFNLITNDSDVLGKISSPKNIESLKFIWALATKVGDSVDGLSDKEDAMDYLCIKSRFMRFKADPATGKTEVVRKSLSRISNENMRRLINRMVYVVCTDILPGLEESALRSEIEAMVTKK